MDALTGQSIVSFGSKGSVDLHKGLGEQAKGLFVTANSPGIIWRDLLILGTRVSESTPAAPGSIRAFDVRTGEIRWIFKTIPDPGEIGYDTWPKGAYQRTGGANGWCGFSLDEETGTVYIPTGSASFDFWGGDRHGENLFANCILALDASTGKRKWHYQTIHHDLWDRDLPAPANLLTVEHNGQMVKALAQITKSGFVFLFNRETGETLYPIDEVAVPKSDLTGEKAHATQPVPQIPPPFVRQVFTEDLLTDISPESNAYTREILKNLRSGERFIPPSVEGTVIFPGFDGGGEWGGAAHDPNRGILYLNANEMPWILTMVELVPDQGDTTLKGRNIYARVCASCHGIDRRGGAFMGNVPALVNVTDRLTSQEIRERITTGKGVMPSFHFLKNDEIEALLRFLNEPPFEASNPREAPLPAESSDSYYAHTGYNKFKDQEGYPAVKPPWGTLNAIDLNLGEILWEHQLPAAGYATPATYMVNGKQYVIIAAGGGKLDTKSGDAYVAFALP